MPRPTTTATSTSEVPRTAEVPIGPLFRVIAEKRESTGEDRLAHLVGPLADLRAVFDDTMVAAAIMDRTLPIQTAAGCIFACLPGRTRDDAAVLAAVRARTNGTVDLGYADIMRSPSPRDESLRMMTDTHGNGRPGFIDAVLMAARSGLLPPSTLLGLSTTFAKHAESMLGKDAPHPLPPEAYVAAYDAIADDRKTMASWLRSGTWNSPAAMAIIDAGRTADADMSALALFSCRGLGPSMAPVVRFRAGLSDAEAASFVAGLGRRGGPVSATYGSDLAADRRFTDGSAAIVGFLSVLPRDGAGRDDAVWAKAVRRALEPMGREERHGVVEMITRLRMPGSDAMLAAGFSGDLPASESAHAPATWLYDVLADTGSATPLLRVATRWGHLGDRTTRPSVPTEGADRDMLEVCSWCGSMTGMGLRMDAVRTGLSRYACNDGVWPDADTIAELLLQSSRSQAKYRHNNGRSAVIAGVLGSKCTDAALDRANVGEGRGLVELLTGTGSKAFLDALAKTPDRVRDGFGRAIATLSEPGRKDGIDPAVAIRLYAAVGATSKGT